MADYYSVIATAVSRLPNKTDDLRDNGDIRNIGPYRRFVCS